jgi:hypothetical protein
MSLNKFRDYSKYELVNIEAKAKKLGLIDGVNNKCCFISNTGDKQIISRDITPADLPTGATGYGTNMTLYQQINDKINIVNTADAVVPIYNDTGAQGSRTMDCSEFQIGDYIECHSSGFYNTRSGQAESLRGLYLQISDGTTTQTWSIYSPPETNPRYSLAFPECVNNLNQGLWTIDVKFIKMDFDGASNNCKVFVRFNSQSNVAGEGSGASCFSELSTTGITFNGTVSVNWSWKYGTGANLSSSFQIYTLDSYVKRVFRIQSAS